MRNTRTGLSTLADLDAKTAEVERETTARREAQEQIYAARERAVAYFSYSNDDGFVEHGTADEAKAQAEESIKDYRSAAMHDKEWPGEVDSVCWGAVLQKATAVDYSEESGEESCDYELHPQPATTERKLVATPDHNRAPVPASPADMQVYNKIAAGYWTERKGPLSKDLIREVFLAHGFTIKEGQTDLKPYVYDAAYALIALVQPATERKGEPVWSDMGTWLWVKLAGYCRRKGLNPHHENDLFNLAGELRAMLAHTSPQVPEDTDPLQGAVDWLCEARMNVSVGLIQQKLHIGYNRAKRLFDAARKDQS